MKVAIYARYSTDMQDRTSIDGQFRNCEALAEQHGFQVVARFRDEGISGTDESRPGYLDLLAAAERGEFDGIVVDETSRLTRNPWELPRLIEDLRYRGQFILSPSLDSRHEAAQLFAGIYSGIDHLELQKIKKRTHRGLRERHVGGFSAGGKTYGYTSEPVDPDDLDSRMRKVIDPAQAKWVVWIFEQYASGIGAKRIAAELNRRGIPSPGADWNRTQRRSDGNWQHSAIIGMAARGSGILRNELYIGRAIWNRSEWIRKPGSATRTYRLRPREEWLIEDRPELRIVPQELWDKVQRRLASSSKSGASRPGRRATYLLTGILKCADCGGSLTMIDKRCYGCGTRNRGGNDACDNPIRIKRADAEARFLACIREYLLMPENILWAEQEILRTLQQPPVDVDRLRKELVKTDNELKNVVEAVATTGMSEAFQAKLTALESRRRQIEEQVSRCSREVCLPNTGAIRKTWKALAQNLGSLSKRATPDELIQARSALKGLLGEVRVDRNGKGSAELSPGSLLPANLVAGAGFEPATFGL